ncbi:MAG: 16S rRNA (cytosine1402-N4)-methyltransferase [Patiriisocius sp.]
MSDYHTAVLLKESVDGLDIKPQGVYVDVTFGAGGHSREILKRLEEGQLVAFDQDEDAEDNLPEDERLVFIRQNFKFLKNHLKANGFEKVDGILADLGVSSHQFDVGERGFSTRFDGKLDMRMDQDSSLTAYEIVNEYEPKELKRIFREGADLRNANKLVDKIIQARSEGEIGSTGRLKEIMDGMVPPTKIAQFLARVFQAIRIEVNGELSVLKDLLLQSEKVLDEGGRLVVISYHSIEDRLVKNFMKTGNFEGVQDKDFYGNVSRPFRPINRKVIVPEMKEVEENGRARSAKLRIAERINE